MLVPARWLLSVLVVAFSGSLVLGLALAAILGREVDWFWASIAAETVFSASLLAGLVWLAWRYGVEVSRVFGPPPRRGALGRVVLMAIPLLLLSHGTIYLVYLPLSYLAPGFVEFWLLDAVPLLLRSGGRYPVLANVIWAASMVLVAPVVEELFFRGFLFRRLARKWGFGAGVVVSSIVFGIPHPDLLGATCFGVAMALIYAHTESLWIPVAVHGTSNLGIWIWGAGGELLRGPQEATLDAFREAWPMGVAGLVIGGAFFAWLLSEYWPERGWSPPVVG